MGLHLAYVSRNFNMQFNERAFLSGALLVELLASATLFGLRVATRNVNLSPTTVLVAHFVREQLSVTIVLVLVFGPVVSSRDQGRTRERASEMESYGVCVSARERQGRASRLSIPLTFTQTP